jgi:hypothetical protein
MAERLHQPVVLAMGSDPVPYKDVAFEFANSTIMDAYADAPFLTADLFKLQRRMKWLLAPKL